MVIPLFIEVNPTRVTKSAKIFLRAGVWRLFSSSEGNYKAIRESELSDPPTGIAFEKKSEEFKGPCYVQIIGVSSKAPSLNILAESY